ncbi:deoxynucleoside kinase [Alcanivorax hongdengensis A-11-3]|uniref:Deoxynucleoside kinase n=1 Tax=Alcanivorax hongdengensis A-11-3 TaxID=1177179 RepID=L0WE89_9GAMM|nr:deoxynucleoside kinase [Alcanivorax hongdengensis]EKF75346.1 deoxynucleoside kinase [Alcanivorax hongdengensis A-11-3]
MTLSKTLSERIEQRRQAGSLPRFIAVEGPIGVGKTSLAKRLAMTFGYDLLLEQAEDNPFLSRFYRDPSHYALQTELFFLFQRADQLRQLQQQDLFAGSRIADFLIDKNRLFAQVTLDEEEFALYCNVDAHLTLDAPRPDLVIYLQAPARTLRQRIVRRGQEDELQISSDYLERLSGAYTEFFHFYDRSPLLIVNAADIDLVNNDQDYQQLIGELLDIRSGRHYFNPRPLV